MAFKSGGVLRPAHPSHLTRLASLCVLDVPWSFNYQLLSYPLNMAHEEAGAEFSACFTSECLTRPVSVCHLCDRNNLGGLQGHQHDRFLRARHRA